MNYISIIFFKRVQHLTKWGWGLHMVEYLFSAHGSRGSCSNKTSIHYHNFPTEPNCLEECAHFLNKHKSTAWASNGTMQALWERERERASIETTLNSIQSSWRGSWNLSKRKQKPEVDHQTLRVCRCHKQERSAGTRELQMSSPPPWEEMGVHRTQESIPGKKVHFENWQIPFCKSRCPARSFLPLSSSLLPPFCFNCPGQ